LVKSARSGLAKYYGIRGVNIINDTGVLNCTMQDLELLFFWNFCSLRRAVEW